MKKYQHCTGTTHETRVLSSLRPFTSVNHGHVGVVAGVRPGASLGGPAPVVRDAGPAARHHVEPEGPLGVPADTDRSLLRVPAEVQALLQVPVVVPHHPQLDCRGTEDAFISYLSIISLSEHLIY